MKKIAISTLLMCSVALPLAQADDKHHPQQGQGAPAATSTTSSAQGMGMMDMNRMQEMHKTMERVQQSKDPAERQRLMQEHTEQMHKMMGDMHGMMGKGMGGGMSAEDRQQMMQKRMDMMQGMMEQMMEHMMAAEGVKQLPGKEQGATDEHDHQKKK